MQCWVKEHGPKSRKVQNPNISNQNVMIGRTNKVPRFIILHINKKKHTQNGRKKNGSKITQFVEN